MSVKFSNKCLEKVYLTAITHRKFRIECTNINEADTRIVCRLFRWAQKHEEKWEKSNEICNLICVCRQKSKRKNVWLIEDFSLFLFDFWYLKFVFQCSACLVVDKDISDAIESIKCNDIVFKSTECAEKCCFNIWFRYPLQTIIG